LSRIVTWYEYDEAEQLACPRCGWSGAAELGARHYFNELFDVSCPHCGEKLLIVSFPTLDETKQEAAKGNPRAIADLPQAQRIEAFRNKFEARKLRSPDQLPEVDGDEPLEFIWDFDDTTGDRETLIRVGSKLLWREPALWEGEGRFYEVKDILRRRYGTRFRSLSPSPESELYLYGDKVSASPVRVE
jgi:hypothetical protein